LGKDFFVALEQAFFTSAEGDTEGPIDNDTAAKFVVEGTADEDLSREDEVATGFALLKDEDRDSN
jgi:hypothetical protein